MAPTSTLWNVRDVAERAAVGATPVPLKLMVWVPPVALVVMVNVALRDPTPAGVKTTLTVQVAPPAILPLQVLVCEKSPGLVPVNVMPVMLKAVEPLLDSVTGCEVLALATV